MQRFLIAGIALSFAALPALAQSGGSSGAERVIAPNAPPPVGSTSTVAPESPPATSGSMGSSTAPSGTMGAVSTEAQVRSRLESSGYSNVTGLMKGDDGLWHGMAMKGSARVKVGVDGQGNVVAN